MNEKAWAITHMQYVLRLDYHLFSSPEFVSDTTSINGHLKFSGAFVLAEIFEKVGFDPYNFRTTRLFARKSEQMKNF